MNVCLNVIKNVWREISNNLEIYWNALDELMNFMGNLTAILKETKFYYKHGFTFLYE